MQRPTIHMPACLVDAKAPARKRPESRAQAAARHALNAKLEEAAREIEALARNVPNWKPALSSAAERVRAKKLKANGETG